MEYLIYLCTIERRTDMAKITIKEYLREHGITQKQLADKLGITQSALSKRLSDDNLTIRQLNEIADILGVSHTALLRADNEVRGSITCPECGNIIRITL